jgi:chemotaxis protein MotA
MDFGTILGLVLGFGLIFASIAFGGGAFGGFIDIPSVLVVIGGTLAVAFIMFSMGTVFNTFKVGMKAFFSKSQKPQDLIELMVKLSETARKESLVALEKVKVEDPFVQKGVQLAADGADERVVKSVLQTEISFMQERHRDGREVFKGMGTMAPAFGMIGTLIGLVKMLQNLSDPASIGPAMAVALLTTFYGAILANVVCLPLAKKLENRSKDEAMHMEIAMVGIIGIIRGVHPAVLREKLLAFLAPKHRID